MKKSVKKIVSVVGMLALSAVTIVAAGASPVKKLAKQLTLGEQYLQEANYDKAAEAYQNALEIDETSIEAYLGLDEALYANGKVDDALAVLDTAFKKTGDEQFKDLIKEQTPRIETVAMDTTGMDLDTYQIKGLEMAADGSCYVVQAYGYGYNMDAPIELEIMFDSNDITTILGLSVLSQSETKGLGSRMEDDSFRAQFAGHLAPVATSGSKAVNPATQEEAAEVNKFDAISNATISSKGVAEIVNNAFFFLSDQVVK